MIKRILAIISGFTFVASYAWAASSDEEPGKSWLHIYTPVENDIYRTKSIPADSLKGIRYTPDNSGRFSEMTVEAAGDSSLTFGLSEEKPIHVEIGPHVATMYIDIENGAEVVEKERYLDASIRIVGNGAVDDFPDTDVRIKGRGNSTWGFLKKPWRLKFDKKQQWCGLAKAKNYALIANYIDPTNMRNSVAFRMAQMLEMPWTNHSVPVNIVMNGSYRGLYMLTEKIGINSGSVDIEETEGILWELDTNYDENYKFRSKQYSLPVMVKDPDFDELEEDDTTGEITAAGLMEKWTSDFQRMEDAVEGVSGEDWTELLDLESVVKYVFVNSLAGNHEPGWPKSVYLHKADITGKYVMGPVWDFDWAYTFGGNYREGGGNPKDPWILLPWESGGLFFRKICEDTRFREAFSLLVEDWYDSRLAELMEYIDEYARLIGPASYANGERWPAGCDTSYPNVGSSESFRTYVENMKQYLLDRISHMHSDSDYGLY